MDINDEFALKYSKEIIVNVANWTNKKGLLKEEHLPMLTKKESKQNIISKKPIHPNGRKFFLLVKLSNERYVETHNSEMNQILEKY